MYILAEELKKGDLFIPSEQVKQFNLVYEVEKIEITENHILINEEEFGNMVKGIFLARKSKVYLIDKPNITEQLTQAINDESK